MNELSVLMRTRVMETLTLLASEEKQRKYQLDVPGVNVPAELFNQWDDCYFPEDSSFRAAFLAGEMEALARFDEALNRVSSDTPQELPALEEFLTTHAWQGLSTAARDALSALGIPLDQPPR